ncbi:HAD hydrolase-like protein [Candidatus Woesearchaeota archaeon]|nr:HAD hydrolase-like protein [Candidatus Woesearchaeota archaeon]
MKPIIAFDFDGVLLKGDIAIKAFHDFFNILGDLLGDDAVRKAEYKEDYWPQVYDVMERLTGMRRQVSLDKSVMVKYARNLYQMLQLAEVNRQGTDAFISEAVDMVVDLKKTCRLAVITTMPEDIVLPALEKAKLRNLLDFVYRSPLNQEPSKTELMKKFVRQVAKPALYVGNEVSDGEACKELGIKFALAKWDRHDKKAEDLAAFNLTAPGQLKGIMGLL